MIRSDFRNGGTRPESPAGIMGILQICSIEIVKIKNGIINPPTHAVGGKPADVLPVFRIILENIVFRRENRCAADGYPCCPSLSEQRIGGGCRPAKNGISFNGTVPVQLLRIGIPALRSLIPLRCNTFVQKLIPVMIHYEKLFSLSGICADSTGSLR